MLIHDQLSRHWTGVTYKSMHHQPKPNHATIHTVHQYISISWISFISYVHHTCYSCTSSGLVISTSGNILLHQFLNSISLLLISRGVILLQLVSIKRKCSRFSTTNSDGTSYDVVVVLNRTATQQHSCTPGPCTSNHWMSIYACHTTSP